MRLHQLAELAGKLAICQGERLSGFGLHHLLHGLRLGQVQPTIQKGTAGELPRLRTAHATRLYRLQRQPRRNRPAMQMELHDVLTRIAVRSRHVDRQTTDVDHTAREIPQFPQEHPTRILHAKHPTPTP